MFQVLTFASLSQYSEVKEFFLFPSYSTHPVDPRLGPYEDSHVS